MGLPHPCLTLSQEGQETLSKTIGYYQGEGINHEGQPFVGSFSLQPLLDGRGFSIKFTATGKDGTVYHKEESTIALSLNEKLTLWNLNTNMPGLTPHELRSTNVKSGAESDEEEFVYVIEGHPDAWVDGELFRLNPGDGVGFPSGTGICHTFINNTETNVRLLVVGEATKKENKCVYALHPELNQAIREKGFLWENPPKHKLGDHDGLPDKLRENS